MTFGGLCIDSIVRQSRGGKGVLPSGWRIDLTGHAFTQESVALIQTSIVLKSVIELFNLPVPDPLSLPVTSLLRPVPTVQNRTILIFFVLCPLCADVLAVGSPSQIYSPFFLSSCCNRDVDRFLCLRIA